MVILIDLTKSGIIGLTNENGDVFRTVTYSDKDYEKVYGDLLKEIWDLGCRKVQIMRKASTNADYDTVIKVVDLSEDEDRTVVAAEYEIDDKAIDRAMQRHKKFQNGN